MRARAALAGLSLCLGGLAHADVAFQPRPVAPHVYSGGWEHYVGGGVAVFDCDGDNFPDLFAAGGEAPATLFRNTTRTPGAPLSFAADTPEDLALTGVTGAYPLDVDGDGLLDLAVLRVGENHLLRGTPDCGFEPFGDNLGFTSDTRWSTAFSATWEDGNALPTLAFGNYVDRTNPDGPFGTCDGNQLYRPEEDRYGAPLTLEPGFCALSMLFSDWGRRGRADLRVSNDRHYYVRGGQEQMWAMERTPRLFGPQDGWRDYQLWGMGIAARDITGDGLAEVYLTSMGDQRFQYMDGAGETPSFRDAGYDLGTTAHRPYAGGDGRPSTGWHAAFGDVQNDGRDDLFVSKGNVEQMPDSAMDDPNNLLLQREDGRFEEAGDRAGLASMGRSRGAALVDMNLDGLLDLAVVNRRAPLEVFENVTPDGGNWLSVLPLQPGPNTQAVGAFVELRAGGHLWTQEITVGGGHAGGGAGALHFGLGEAASVDLRVIWPDGEISEWLNVAPNRIVSVDPTGGLRDLLP